MRALSSTVFLRSTSCSVTTRRSTTGPEPVPRVYEASFTYRQLLGGDPRVHHRLVHGLQGVEVGRGDEHHVRHEFRRFQDLQGLWKDTAGSEPQDLNSNPVWITSTSHLWIDIQDAGASRRHHLVDGLHLGAVQVTVVLAMFQEPARFDVYLHLRPCGEVIGVPVQLVVTGTA